MRAIALFACLLTASLHAATYPPHYRWQTLTTAHFLVHYHQGEEDLARRAAAIAEAAHERLVPIFGWTPRERTHLVLTDHVDVSNGSATPFPNNRIEIYVSAPGADPTSALEYYDNWLNLVITHEYAHVLHLDQARGFARLWRSVFGREIVLGFPNLWSPAWLIEGIATLVESEATDAGRLKGTFVEMVLRTAAIENQFATEGQASGSRPYWPGGNARYFYGSKFLSWLAAQHGAEKLRQYVNEYSGNIVPFRVNATAKDVYGTSMKSLWNEWSREQQAAYRAEHAALGSLTRRERLTGLGYVTKYPLLSPDATRLAYVHRGPFERGTLRVRDLAGGRDVATHPVNSGSALSWSADGGRIAFSQLEYYGSHSVLSDLYVWEVGGAETRITRGARLTDPSFTPDGRSLIAVENRAGRNRIVEVDIAGGTIRPIVEPAGYVQFSEPAVSHDGRRIAVAQWDAGRVDVVLYDRRGKRLANLTQRLPRSTNASPRFSRDDSTIYFSSDVTGISNIFSVPAAGGAVRRLTNVYGGAFFPTTRDGRRFYYSDYSSGGFDVAMFDATRTWDVTPRTIPGTVMGARDIPSVSALRIPEPLAAAGSAPYSPWRSLRPRWWFPILEGGGSEDEGTQVTFGATTSGSDVLGFHTYTATAAATLREETSDAHYSLLYSYDRLYPTITAGAFRYDEGVVRFVTGDEGATYTQTTHRFIAQATVPFYRYRWQTAAWGGVVRDEVSSARSSEIVPDDLARFGIFRGTLQGFRAGAIFNSAQQYAFSVSPENGVTARLDYENLSRSLGSDASLQQLRADVRGYVAIPYRRSPLGRHVVAARLAGAQNSGQYVLQRDLRVGGSYDVGFPHLDIRSLPVRGYAGGTLRGRRAAIAQLEYRFPLWEIDRGPATWPIFFNRVVGAAFADAGRAWGETLIGTNDATIASAGAEAGLDVILGHYLPLRYRLGAAWLLRDPGKGEVKGYMALSTSF
ncbi:MAG TPA: LpqB family beta-propeller domain-containing protein [Thermoanaerobaculia bacterium]|nr:LpqB family beta-propeller domain-containing protein [Thermoanaerobaculia bacterium]